jgi:hypothetical protein
VQGNCSQPSPLVDARYAWRMGQCVLTVREDFLQLDILARDFWMHQVYVRIVGNATGSHDEATLIGVQQGNLYLTDVTFIADGYKSRAIDVNEGNKLYARGVNWAICCLVIVTNVGDGMEGSAVSKAQ